MALCLGVVGVMGVVGKAYQMILTVGTKGVVKFNMWVAYLLFLMMWPALLFLYINIIDYV